MQIPMQMTSASDRWPRAWRQGETVSPHLQRVHRTDALMGIAAPAKLNLGLAVVGRRTDGYHKLVTLFVTLALADTVRVEPATTLTLISDDPALTTGDDNLCLRAARALQTATGTSAGARISLTKRIPVAAGLGGGSSDAAATLRALDALWDTHLSDTALLVLARSLGADVPFFLCGTDGNAVMARGIGDLLWPVVPVPPVWVVLVVPEVDILYKTAALYAALTEAEYDRGEAVGQQMTALRGGKTVDAALLDNSFLAPLERLAPVVAVARQAMIAAGLLPALSGSGPTLYALCATEAEATEVANHLRGRVDARIIVTSLSA